MSGVSFDVLGTTFTSEVTQQGFSPGSRLLACVVAHGAITMRGADDYFFATKPGAVDLALVRTGRAPLLREHSRYLDALLGRIVDAEVRDDALHCVAELAPLPEADRIWTLLTAGFPLSLSLGGIVRSAKAMGDNGRGGRLYAVDHWELSELSVVVFGAERKAHVRLLSGESLAALNARRLVPPSAEAQRVRSALHLDRWEEWALRAAPVLAGRVGCPIEAMQEALPEAVRQHIESMETRLAA